MIRKDKGHVVAISSVAAHFGQSYSSAYRYLLTDREFLLVIHFERILSASKFAIRGLMESLMWEMKDLNKPQIKTTIIYPYFTKTPLLDDIDPLSRYFCRNNPRT